MTSVDKVQTDLRSLPSIESLGLSAQNVTLVNCQRNINASSFSNGIQDFLFGVAGTERFSPHRSYFRARLTLMNTSREAPICSERLAIAENAMANLYSNAYFYVGNQDISSLSQHNGQAGMFKYRMSKSKQWSESIGNAAYNLDADINNRINKTAVDGAMEEVISDGCTDTKKAVNLGYDGGDLNLLSIDEFGNATVVNGGAGTIPLNEAFRVGDVISVQVDSTSPVVKELTRRVVLALPTNTSATTGMKVSRGNVVQDAKMSNTDEFVVYRSTGWRTLILPTERRNQVEVLYRPPLGIFDSDVALPAGQFKISLMPKSNTLAGIESDIGTKGILEVDSMYFFCSTFRDDKGFENDDYYLNLHECNIQTKTLGTGNSQSNFNFTLPSSTTAIGVWCQAMAQGTDTRVPSSKFNSLNGSGTSLEHIQCVYAGEVKPKQDYDSIISENPPGSIPTLTAANGNAVSSAQYVLQRYVETTLNNDLYHVGCETFEDYLRRGNIYFFSWIKDADNASTEAQITMTYSNLEADTQVYVLSVYRNLVKVSVMNGFITEVQKLAM